MESFGQAFGALVLERRQRQKLSQEDLIRQAFPRLIDNPDSITAKINTLSRLENGHTNVPHIDNIYALCIVLRINVEDLLKCYSSADEDLVVSRLLGAWDGIARQVSHETLGSLEFKQGAVFERFERGRFSGTCRVEYPELFSAEERVQIMSFSAKVRFQNVISLEYHNSDRQFLQFGTVYLSLQEVEDILSGDFVGFGPTSNGVVAGNMTLTKQT